MKYVIYFLLIALIVFRFLITRLVFEDNQKIRITDRVVQEPVKYQYFQKISLANFSVYLPLYPEISYGDKVIVEGRGEKNKLKEAKLVRIEKDKNLLYQFRTKIIEVYQKSLPQPHSGLISGITLGSKGQLTSSFWESLKKTSVAHVVVASGMNVTMLASFLFAAVAIFFPRRKAIPIALIGIWFYVVMAGFDAPIVRAGIMGSIVFLAQEKGRLVSSFRILIFSALLMLIIRPFWLFDLGFILSFVATLSLMLFEAKIRAFFKFIPKILKEGLSTSLAAQIGVAPILFVTFGQFFILSPVVNALVLWTIPLIMVIGFIGGLAGLLWFDLGRLILYLAYPLTWWFISIIEIFQ